MPSPFFGGEEKRDDDDHPDDDLVATLPVRLPFGEGRGGVEKSCSKLWYHVHFPQAPLDPALEMLGFLELKKKCPFLRSQDFEGVQV